MTVRAAAEWCPGLTKTQRGSRSIQEQPHGFRLLAAASLGEVTLGRASIWPATPMAMVALAARPVVSPLRRSYESGSNRHNGRWYRCKRTTRADPECQGDRYQDTRQWCACIDALVAMKNSLLRAGPGGGPASITRPPCSREMRYWCYGALQIAFPSVSRSWMVGLPSASRVAR
jgi:hypothetical protein